MSGLLTKKELREILFDKDILSGIFKYHCKTGKLTRRVSFCNSTYVGEEVGAYDNSTNYLVTSVLGVKLYVHQIVWILHNGPYDTKKNVIDHISGDPLDSRIENLRLSDKRGNAINTRKERRDNSTGITGVTTTRKSGELKYVSQICINGRCFRPSAYTDLTEAVAHRLAMEQCLGWDKIKDISSAYQYMQKYLKGEI